MSNSRQLAKILLIISLVSFVLFSAAELWLFLAFIFGFGLSSNVKAIAHITFTCTSFLLVASLPLITSFVLYRLQARKRIDFQNYTISATVAGLTPLYLIVLGLLIWRKPAEMWNMLLTFAGLIF